MRIGLKMVGAALLLAASGEITSAEAASPAPVVSHPSTSSLSPRLSDLPTAHWVQTQQGLKLVPPPKPLLPRGVGPSVSLTGRVERMVTAGGISLCHNWGLQPSGAVLGGSAGPKLAEELEALGRAFRQEATELETRGVPLALTHRRHTAQGTPELSPRPEADLQPLRATSGISSRWLGNDF